MQKSVLLLAAALATVAPTLFAIDSDRTGGGQARRPRLATQPTHDSDLGRPRTVSSLAFEPDGPHLAACYTVAARNRPGTDWGTWVTQWNLQSGERVTVPKATAPILFSHDGKKLAMAAWERSRERGKRMSPQKKLALWRLGEKEPYRILQRGENHDDSVVAATFAYEGTRVVSLNGSGEVILWELDSDNPPLVLSKVPKSSLRRAASSLSYDRTGMGKIIVLVPAPVQDDRSGRSRGPDSGALFVQILKATDGPRRKFREEYSGKHVFGRPPFSRFAWPLGRSSPLTVPTTWLPQLSRLPASSISSGSRTRGLGVHRRVSWCYRKGHRWTAIGETGYVSLFSERDSRPAILPFGGPVVAFNHDGSRLATANRQGVVRIWNLDSERIERSLRDDGQPADTFRVAAVQAASLFGKSEENRAKLSKLVAQAAWMNAKIVVLPETAISGYMSQDLTKTWQVGERPLSAGLTGVDPDSVAETVPGPSTEHFSSLARRYSIYITVPFLEVDRKAGMYYNTVVLLDPAGRIVLHYRKRNPWPWAERGWATEGTLGNPVVDTPFGRLATLVCYDVHEQAKILGNLKVDTLLYSIAWVEDKGGDWFAVRLPEVARSHGFDIVGANWTVTPKTTDSGEKRKPTWHGYGQSLIIQRDGKVLQRVEEDLADEIIYADLPLP